MRHAIRPSNKDGLASRRLPDAARPSVLATGSPGAMTRWTYAGGLAPRADSGVGSLSSEVRESALLACAPRQLPTKCLNQGIGPIRLPTGRSV